MKNTQDKPPTEILYEWVKSNYIKKSGMSKIMKGKKI
jgi:hypothetical protein